MKWTDGMEFSTETKILEFKKEIVKYVEKNLEKKLFKITDNSGTNKKAELRNILSFHYPQSVLNHRNNIEHNGEQKKYHILNFYIDVENGKISVLSKLFRYQNVKDYTKTVFETKREENLKMIFKSIEKEIVKIQLNNLY
jgi:hypothetical protein